MRPVSAEDALGCDKCDAHPVIPVQMSFTTSSQTQHYCLSCATGFNAMTCEWCEQVSAHYTGTPIERCPLCGFTSKE